MSDSIAAQWRKLSRPPGWRLKPAPGAEIPATYEECLALLRKPRMPEPHSEAESRRLAATLAGFPELFRPVLLQLLGAELAELVADGVCEALTAERRPT